MGNKEKYSKVETKTLFEMMKNYIIKRKNMRRQILYIKAELKNKDNLYSSHFNLL